MGRKEKEGKSRVIKIEEKGRKETVGKWKEERGERDKDDRKEKKKRDLKRKDMGRKEKIEWRKGKVGAQK